MAEYRGIKLIVRLVIETFSDNPTQVLLGGDDVQDRSADGVTHDQVLELAVKRRTI